MISSICNLIALESMVPLISFFRISFMMIKYHSMHKIHVELDFKSNHAHYEVADQISLKDVWKI